MDYREDSNRIREFVGRDGELVTLDADLHLVDPESVLGVTSPSSHASLKE